MHEMNLLPPKLRKKPRKQVKIANPTYAPFLLIMVLGVSFSINGVMDNNIDTLSKEQKTLVAERSTLQSRLDSVAALKGQIESLRTTLSSKTQQTIADRMEWDLLLNELAYSTPSEVAVTSIEETESGAVRIKAQTFTLKNMAKMEDSLNKNKHFKNIALKEFIHDGSNIVERPFKIGFEIVMQYSVDGVKVYSKTSDANPTPPQGTTNGSAPVNGTQTTPATGTPTNGTQTTPASGTPTNGTQTTPASGTPTNGTQTTPASGSVSSNPIGAAKAVGGGQQ